MHIVKIGGEPQIVMFDIIFLMSIFVLDWKIFLDYA